MKLKCPHCKKTIRTLAPSDMLPTPLGASLDSPTRRVLGIVVAKPRKGKKAK